MSREKTSGVITWDDNDASSKASAMEAYSHSQESFGSVHRSSASSYGGYSNVEPNRSVRSGYSRTDYYNFRPKEKVPQRHKDILKMCMDAYDKVGIIRNIIDLMGDFGSQGVNLVHENKSVERFYNQWFKKVNGKERSERFLNNLYRTGNVIMYRSNAKITPKVETYLKSMANDVMVEAPNYEKSVIPWRYNFFNPCSVDMKDGELALSVGNKNFTMNLSKFYDNFKNGDVPAHVLKTLPDELKERLKKGEQDIPLDPERLEIYYYKKDDWQQWANPMIYAILDDIIMLEKMRLADLTALDGAISSVRLWTLGNYEHRILPTKEGIDAIRDILASNSTGGSREIVWGPELKYQESNSQVYKWLGSEKYVSVLNAIYAGMGVPPTLTGQAGGGGGFTNNFISLKTLTERLQYGRSLLTKFWEKEIEIVRKSMGFRKGAYVQFDQMTLSDEAAEKNLLLQLVDRNIISDETILERFKEIPAIEKIRTKREEEARSKGDRTPKASPYHNAEHSNEMDKVAMQGGKVLPRDVNMRSSIPDKNLTPAVPVASKSGGPSGSKKKSPGENGRPKFKLDTSKRKQRVAKPRSTPGIAEIMNWVEESWSVIEEVAHSAYLHHVNKKDMRQITKSQVEELERIKLNILSYIDPYSEVDTTSVVTALKNAKGTPEYIKQRMFELNVNTKSLSINAYKRQVAAIYVEYLLEKL